MSPGHHSAGGDPTPPLRYMLPGAAGAVWLGLGWVSIAGLAVTVIAVLLLLLAGLPLWSVTPLAAGGAAVSALPVAGRPLLGWLPTLLAHQAAQARGTSSWARPLAQPAPHVRDTGAGTVSARTGGGELRISVGVGPRYLRVLTPWAAGDPHPPALAAIEAASRGAGRGRDRRCTLVFEVLGLGRFGVLDPGEQDTELARWGSGLAVLYADPSVHAVQWLTHARPDTRTCPPPAAPWPADRGDPHAAGPGGVGELQADYRHLTEIVTAQASRHRHLLALTLNLPSRGGAAATIEGAAEEPLALAARDIATALLTADLLARPLGATELGTDIRLLLDPTAPDNGPATDPAQWQPVSTRTHWDRCQTDDTVHRSFTIMGWPRLALSADWLAPLLHDTPSPGTSRTLSVHTRPVATEHAARRARAASAKAQLDASDRNRLGFTPHTGGSVSDTLAETDAAATEAELVAGYRMTDLTALLTVSAADTPRLDAACRQVRALAAAHRLDLRPLHGQHLPALAATLPLGLNPGSPT